MTSTPHNSLPRPAELRDVGAACPHCDRLIQSSDRVVACSGCGAVHHEACWLHYGGCGTYECAPARRDLRTGQQAEIHITASELDRAVPLVRATRPPMGAVAPSAYTPRRDVATPGTRNRLAIASALVAAFAGMLSGGAILGRFVAGAEEWVVGFSLFGAVVLGILALFMGAFALGTIQKAGQRGVAWGILAILAGLMISAGSIVVMAFSMPGLAPGTISLEDMQVDPAHLDGVQPQIARAVRANVLIESSITLAGQAIGSGVIVGRQQGATLIVTNRHVVDAKFHDRGASTDLPTTNLRVSAIGQLPVAGRVVWVAPDGLDIAVISAPIHSDEAEVAPWDVESSPALGDEVFSIGNPQGLAWTHTKGSVSQVRSRKYGSRQIGMIQTDTAINPGNSGGGLYDEAGNLIGINTWTNDKRMSEGLSFAISFASVVKLNPPFVRNP